MKKGKFDKAFTLVIAETCNKLYQNYGVEGVIDYANRIKLAYGYCIPCEAEMPMIQYHSKNECACCGSIIHNKVKLKRENFLDWYFTDTDDLIQLGKRVLKELLSVNTSLITTNELFNDCEYIPNFICENNDFDDDKEFKTFEVELID